MTFKIYASSKFKKEYEKLNTLEKDALKKKTRILSTNPFHPSLRTHKVIGYKDTFEFSVNMDIRVIWRYESDREIVLSEIGHHDILKKY